MLDIGWSCWSLVGSVCLIPILDMGSCGTAIIHLFCS